MVDMVVRQIYTDCATYDSTYVGTHTHQVQYYFEYPSPHLLNINKINLLTELFLQTGNKTAYKINFQ